MLHDTTIIQGGKRKRARPRRDVIPGDQRAYFPPAHFGGLFRW